MTPDPDAVLTAFALNDPGLSAADRAAVETRLAADPAAVREVEEIRAVSASLTAGFAAELAASPTGAVTVPSEKAAPAVKKRTVGWLPYVTIASLMLAVSTAVFTLTGNQAKPMFSRVGFSFSGGRSANDTFQTAALAMPGGPPAGSPADDRLDIQLASRGDRPAPPAASAPGQGAGFNGGFAGNHGFGGGAAGFGGGFAGGFAGGGMPTPTPRPAAPHPFGLTLGGKPEPGKPVVTLPTPLAVPVPPAGPDGYLTAAGKPTDNKDAGKFYDTPHHPEPTGGDQFSQLIENPFVTVEGQNALSTFGVDVDTASYAIVRKFLTAGQRPPTSAVRLEEIVNYFPYQDKPPTGADPFAVTVEMAVCPWATGHRLARIGLKAKPVAADKRPPSNLVFLLDVSGSMNEPNKLPLVKSALKLLVNQLGENDRVAMVVYAGAAGLVLDSTSAANKNRILEALDRLEAGGSTNGAGGLQQAYDVAVTNFVKGGTNRVILCTDGDWNVGTTGTGDLVTMIEGKRKTGVFLSVFGFGMGNLRDEMMVKLAGKGNGNYGYIDTLREANKALVEQIGGTLVTVAKDVKIQVEFNPAAVKAYRLLGYEKRALAAKDFADDTKDAGEMGAGHVVTALYELVPAGAAAAPVGEGLRYQPNPESKPVDAPVGAGNAAEAFLVKMRHKKPDGDVSTLRELPVPNKAGAYDAASEDFRFAAAAASFALVLRESTYKGTASLTLAQELAESATKFDPSGYRAEFVELVRKARTVTGK
ncbi:MAG: YfbK domain-containing protein [Fimbriiglobus sp.]